MDAPRRQPAPPVVVPARRPLLRRDLALPLAAIAAVALAVASPDVLRGPAPVLLAVFACLATLAWGEDLVRSWAVGADFVASRRWAGWRRLSLDDVRAVDLVDADADPFGETLVFSGRRLRAVAVPLRPARADERFAPALLALVEGCRQRGVAAPAAVEAAARAARRDRPIAVAPPPRA